jgi:hypothetical protein
MSGCRHSQSESSAFDSRRGYLSNTCLIGRYLHFTGPDDAQSACLGADIRRWRIVSIRFLSGLLKNPTTGGIFQFGSFIRLCYLINLNTFSFSILVLKCLR